MARHREAEAHLVVQDAAVSVANAEEAKVVSVAQVTEEAAVAIAEAVAAVREERDN